MSKMSSELRFLSRAGFFNNEFKANNFHGNFPRRLFRAVEAVKLVEICKK